MKTIRIAVLLLAGGFLPQLALSQTNTNVADTGMATNAVETSTSPGGAATTNGAGAPAMPMVAQSNATTTVTSNASPMETTNAVVPEVTNTLPMTEGSATTASTAETTTAPGENGQAPAAPSVAPISFTDVPLDVAIQALAREAGINYLLDPAIGWGQPDQNGQIRQPPTLSVRWEGVTAEQALLALLDNYGLDMIENPKTKIAKITLKSPNALPPLITRVIQLRYASPTNMLNALTGSLSDKRSRIVADVRTSQLVVVATDPEQSTIDTLIADLDKPTRQVLIETKFVEVSSNPSTSKGIDWAGTLQAQNFSFGNGQLNGAGVTPSVSTINIPGLPVTVPGFGGGASTTTSPGSSSSTTLNSEPENSLNPGGFTINTANGLSPDIGFLSADGVKAIFSFLNQSTEAQVVSTPRVVTLDNQTATIQVTTEFPVINVQAGTQVTAGGSSISYSNIGTILLVTPRITANDYIWLSVNPQVSTFAGTDNKTIDGFLYQADIFDSRVVQSEVLIPNAHTLVMGGLMQDNPNAGYTKVPILGDIPGLGFLFRSENNSLSKDNLLIFITPTILKDSDFKPMQTEFLNSEPRTLPEPMNMHSWWDSAQPRGNWSDPIPPQDEPSSQMPTNNTAPSSF